MQNYNKSNKESSTRGSFNGKPLERYTKNELLDILVWQVNQSKERERELLSTMEFIKNAASMF